MSGENEATVEGVIVEALANGTYRVELANGHRFLGFLGRRDRLNGKKFVPRERVWCRLSVCDLSKGRIEAGTVE